MKIKVTTVKTIETDKPIHEIACPCGMSGLDVAAPVPGEYFDDRPVGKRWFLKCPHCGMSIDVEVVV